MKYIDEVRGAVNLQEIAPFDGERPSGIDCSVESTGNAVEDSQMERITLILSRILTTLTVLEP